MGVSIVMELPQKRWMVYFMEDAIEMDDIYIYVCVLISLIVPSWQRLISE